MSETTNATTDPFKVTVEEMAQAGLHLGHALSLIHPDMRQYVYGMKNGVHIIDLEKAAVKLREALVYVQQAIEKGKVVLLVGTKVQAKAVTKACAIALQLPYITERWLGGTLTNFKVIKERIEYLKSLEQKRDSADFSKYTKKEQAVVQEEIAGLERKFGGLRSLTRLPDIIVVLDMKRDELACKEARKMGVTVVGVADTNVDPQLADLVIPVNDDATAAIQYILARIQETVATAQKKIPVAK